MATDLQHSHCHFKSHMEYYFRSLTPFLPLFCSCQFRRLYSVQFQAHIQAGWRLETRLFTSDSCSVLLNTSLQPFCTDHAENTASIVKEACLLVRCLSVYVLMLRALACEGMCLPSRCLAMATPSQYVLKSPESCCGLFNDAVVSRRR
jgi:hypothetical protein